MYVAGDRVGAGRSNWAINYWRSNVFTAAVAQLLAFYALVGLAGQHLIDRINRRVLIEFGVVMVIVAALVAVGTIVKQNLPDVAAKSGRFSVTARE